MESAAKWQLGFLFMSYTLYYSCRKFWDESCDLVAAEMYNIVRFFFFHKKKTSKLKGVAATCGGTAEETIPKFTKIEDDYQLHRSTLFIPFNTLVCV